MRANAARFAAHKAHYVRGCIDDIMNDEKIPQGERQAQADAAMNQFHRWGETEEGYATASAQTARKWADFEIDGDEYYLQYRTAKDEKVRDEHRLLDDTTLPMSDPFWDKYYPPLGWNCRCTVVQVRKSKHKQSVSKDACKAGDIATANAPSFRFNPGKQRKAFPDGVSYLKHGGNTNEERQKTEGICKNLSMPLTVDTAKESLLNSSTECTIVDKTNEVIFISLGLKEYAQSMQKTKQFWIKNEILPNISKYIRNGKCVGRKVSDTTHNTNKKTLRIKRNADYFYYFETTLPNGDTVYIHLGRYKQGHEREGKMFLYTITKNLPENTEMP